MVVQICCGQKCVYKRIPCRFIKPGVYFRKNTDVIINVEMYIVISKTFFGNNVYCKPINQHTV